MKKRSWGGQSWNQAVAAIWWWWRCWCWYTGSLLRHEIYPW